MNNQKIRRAIGILLIVLLIATVSVTTVSAEYIIIIKSKSYKTTSSPTSYGGNWAGPSNPGGPPLVPDTSVPATYGGTATFGNQFASPHIIWVNIGGQGGAFGGIGGTSDVSSFPNGQDGPDGPGGPGEPSGYTVIIGDNYGIW